MIWQAPAWRRTQAHHCSFTPRERTRSSSLAELTRLGATNIVVLAGTSAVSQGAANLTGCTSWPSRHFEEHERQRFFVDLGTLDRARADTVSPAGRSSRLCRSARRARIVA